MDDELPHQFYSSLWTRLSRRKVADLFGRHGWSVRKCSWTDYEVITDLAELVIEADHPILVHGSIASVSEVVPVIDAVLSSADIEYTFEGYDEDDNLVLSRLERRTR